MRLILEHNPVTGEIAINLQNAPEANPFEDEKVRDALYENARGMFDALARFYGQGEVQPPANKVN